MAENRYEKKPTVSGFLLSALHENSTVQGLLDSAFDQWLCPSLFLTMSWKIQYYSRYSPEYNAWEPVFEDGVIRADIQDDLVRSILSVPPPKNGPQTPIPFNAGRYSYILSTVRVSGTLSGFLLIHCSPGRTPETIMPIASGLSEAMAFLLEKESPSAMHHDLSYTRNYIAQELLLTRESDTTPLWFHVQGVYRIAVVKAGTADRDMLPLVERTFAHAFQDCYLLISGNLLYVFFYHLADMKDNDRTQKFIYSLMRVMNGYPFCAALSSGFTDIRQRHLFRKQALDLASYAETFLHPKSHVLDADVYYLDLILYASIHRTGSETLLLNETSCLHDYDRKNGTEYLLTLSWYLKCSGSIRTAAAGLHIEPKTLRYRLNKICSLVHRSKEDLLSDSALLFSAIANSRM